MRMLRNLRWYIGALLFLSTVINYIDRQTLSVLAPYIKQEYRWTNSDFALLIIAFRVAYAVGQTAAGRFLDRVGTRTGLTATVAFYSVAAMLTSTAVGLRSFCSFRFLLGLGEAANWPGATKAVSEWFPKRESGWAVALFDSGSSVGAAIAPFLVLGVYHYFGSWRPAFLFTGALGFAWLLLFRFLYRSPETHPMLTGEERDMILNERASHGPARNAPLSYRTLLSLPQTWGIILGKTLTDPVWFFITDWFAIFLVSKGHRLEDSLFAFWVPFLAADVGNFAGGGVSSWLIRRGWGVGAARKFSGHCVRARHDTARACGVHRFVRVAGGVFRDLDVILRGVVDDDPELTRGCVPDGLRRFRQRAERHRRGDRHDCGHLPDGQSGGREFVRTGTADGECGAAARRRGGARARQKHARDARRHRQSDLIR